MKKILAEQAAAAAAGSNIDVSAMIASPGEAKPIIFLILTN